LTETKHILINEPFLQMKVKCKYDPKSWLITG